MCYFADGKCVIYVPWVVRSLLKVSDWTVPHTVPWGGPWETSHQLDTDLIISFLRDRHSTRKKAPEFIIVQPVFCKKWVLHSGTWCWWRRSLCLQRSSRLAWLFTSFQQRLRDFFKSFWCLIMWLKQSRIPLPLLKISLLIMFWNLSRFPPFARSWKLTVYCSIVEILRIWFLSLTWGWGGTGGWTRERTVYFLPSVFLFAMAEQTAQGQGQLGRAEDYD